MKENNVDHDAVTAPTREDHFIAAVFKKLGPGWPYNTTQSAYWTRATIRDALAGAMRETAAEAMPLEWPPGLHPNTLDLVKRFAVALAEKLHADQVKYAHGDNWSLDVWETDCRNDFHEHVGKGDPLDVAAYCAFMWHHGWSTAETPTSEPAVMVKPLEWTDHPAGGKQAFGAGVGLYRVHPDGSTWYLDHHHMGIGGIVAAEADFKRSIHSIFGSSPSCEVVPQEPEAAVDLLRQIQSRLMRHRLFGRDSLSEYRRMLTDVEVEIEKWFVDCSHQKSDQRASQEMYEALEKISTIKNIEYGGDWDEIEEARNIARAVLDRISRNKMTSDDLVSRLRISLEVGCASLSNGEVSW